jgi:hypothetical protein
MSEQENTNKSEPKQASGQKKFDFGTTVQQLWNGKIPLFEAFWIYYFAAMIVLTVLSSVLAPLSFMFGTIRLAWAGFMVKPIWLAAENYKGDQKYALLAKGAAILIALGALGDLLA